MRLKNNAEGMYIGPEFAVNKLEKYKTRPDFTKSQVTISLSPREMEVLVLVGDGLTNVEIANKLFTSRRTVETHRKRLLEKTNTTNTATLIKFAVLNGLLK